MKDFDNFTLEIKKFDEAIDEMKSKAISQLLARTLVDDISI